MQLIVIIHNIRSIHNVGSILRTCEGFGINKVFCTGYTPFPTQPDDMRLPHLRNKITKQIHKTALGAETLLSVEQSDDLSPVIAKLKNDEFTIVALEQSPRAIMLPDYKPQTQKLALLLGEEVHGITPELLLQCDQIIEIPMRGKKESFNVSVATGIALYAISLTQPDA